MAAFESAPKMMETVAPTATVKGLGGFEVTPAGSVPSVTCTEPANPFSEFTERLTVELVAPCVRETEVVERVTEKSGEGGGGGAT